MKFEEDCDDIEEWLKTFKSYIELRKSDPMHHHVGDEHAEACPGCKRIGYYFNVVDGKKVSLGTAEEEKSSESSEEDRVPCFTDLSEEEQAVVEELQVLMTSVPTKIDKWYIKPSELAMRTWYQFGYLNLKKLVPEGFLQITRNEEQNICPIKNEIFDYLNSSVSYGQFNEKDKLHGIGRRISSSGIITEG